MNDEIRREVEQRKITRICHFTPSRNLGQILAGNVGILATKQLKDSERLVYAATDLLRMDGCLDHICCSIEYPNAWYFDKARSKELLFKDWVILLLDSRHLWVNNTRFCVRNAAASSGRNVSSGYGSFKELFADKIVGARGQTFGRTPTRAPACPTDEQAEVLVPDTIKLSDLMGIAVVSEEQAKNELVRMKLLGIPEETRRALNIWLGPDLFDKYKLSSLIKEGKRPVETLLDTRNWI